MKNKTIGLNVLFLIPRKVGGSETYTRGLIESLVSFDKTNSYIIFCNLENYSSFRILKGKRVKIIRLPVRATNRFGRLFFEQLIFPFYLAKHKIDIVHSWGYVCPFFTPCKSIVTIFDLNWFYHPEDFSFLERAAWGFFVKNSALHSDLVITSSESSKKSLDEVLGVGEKTIVVYPGVPKMRVLVSKSDLPKTIADVQYVFTLSAMYPHKNLITLLKAFNLVSKKIGDLKLVIAGLKGRAEGTLRQYMVAKNLAHRIVILGWVDDKLLATLYKYATAFVFTSRYEGFGIPLLESFRSGTPVISSNAFSLAEVLGNGGVAVKPDDYRGFADEIYRVATDREYRHKLVSMSRLRSRDFSWKAASKRIVGAYKNILTDG